MEKLSYIQLQKLFVEAKNGNEDSFKEIYDATYRAQYFIAYNYLNDQFLAQEAVQNMYISFYNHLDKITNGMAIIHWMNTTTINECRSLIRKEKLNSKTDIEDFKDKIVDDNLNPEEAFFAKEDKETVNKALNSLESKYKKLLIYRYIENLKIREISELTKIPSSTIARNIKEASDKLKKAIENIVNNKK